MSVMCFLGLCCTFLVPETTGLSLEEIVAKYHDWEDNATAEKGDIEDAPGSEDSQLHGDTDPLAYTADLGNSFGYEAADAAEPLITPNPTPQNAASPSVTYY
jgi:hypothetical protein